MPFPQEPYSLGKKKKGSGADATRHEKGGSVPSKIGVKAISQRTHQIDYFTLAADLDIVSWDNYPFGLNGTNRPPQPLPHDLMRGLKQQNVWVMEQGSGAGGWGSYPATPQPGQMRLWAYQAVARGADMISFFRWRSCRWGREQYWHGILYHHGIPQRRYEEAKQAYFPFDRLVEEDVPTREALARLAARAAARGREVFITINNKAEGSAPCSVASLAAAIVAASAGDEA